MLWKNPATVSCTYSRKPVLWYSRSVYSSWYSVIVPRKVPLDQTRSYKTSPIPWSLSPSASKRRLCSEAFEAWHVDLGKTDARNAALPDGRFGIGRYPLHMAGSSCVIMCVFDVEGLTFGVKMAGWPSLTLSWFCDWGDIYWLDLLSKGCQFTFGKLRLPWQVMTWQIAPAGFF